MDRKKKKFQKKKIWLACGLAVGIVIVSGGVYFVQGKSAGKASAEEMPVQETQAKKSTISNSIVGTGNLEYEQGEAVTIPTGIIVEEVKVESGDQVSKGDILALVNQTSVLRTMEEIQEKMEELDEEINENKEESDTQSVKSKVDGRVKKIYVQQGQEASECMVEQGALLLLSIDGFLAVAFETDADIAKDDSVIVDRADGTQKEGIVKEVSNGTCTVLFSDSGIGIEEEVTISDSNDNILGSGATYIHQPLTITAASGIVEEICVSEDEKVYTDTVLFTIDQGGESLKYQEQMAERQELAQNLQKLMVLFQSGAIIAESSGTVQSVTISAGSSQSTQGNTGTVQISKQNTQGSTVTAAVSTQYSQSIQGSAVAAAVSTQYSQSIQGSAVAAAVSTQYHQINTGIVQLSKQDSDTDIDSQMPYEEQGTDLSLEITDSGKTNQNFLVIETPKTGKKPQTELTAVDGSYEGVISWMPEDKKFTAKTSYQAKVELYAAEGYSFTKESIRQIKTGVLSGMSVSEDGKTLTFQITYPMTEAEENEENPNNNGNNDGNGNQNENNNNIGDENQNENNNNGNGNQNENGNNDGNGNQNSNGNNESNGNNGENGNTNSTGNNGGNGNQNENQDGNENQNENGNREGIENNNTNGNQEGNGSGIETGGDHAQSSNGISQVENSASNGQTQTASANTSDSGSRTLTSSASSSGSVQSSSTETSSDTDDSEITAFTLATADTMILSVNVDELDINSVSNEQQAEIVLDAIEDEVFTGTVKKVGNSASSSSGGVAKYTVEISIPRDERMKEGMNASATITVEERENVVTIPVNALQERGSRVFVYTETDGEGTLLGEKEVTTGLSDGSNVEITEGLSEGDVVYYHKIGNTSQKNSEQNFHKMEGGPGGEMGNMRQGGFPGGDSGGGMPSGRE